LKVLILGGQGMAGHMIVKYFQKRTDFDVFYTTRNPSNKDSVYLDVTNTLLLENIIGNIKPDIIINCIGILNDFATNNPKLAFQVNSLLPHQLVKLAERYNGKVIHISTDCVFSGEKGNYNESDTPDGTTVYAQSKQLGEIISNQHLTIRTSIIGPELKSNGIGLLLWFMNQSGQIKGYEKVLWNGVTALELAKAIEEMIKNNITGLYHLGSNNKISKYSLLCMLKEIFNKTDVDIIPDSKIELDRTIKSSRKDYHYLVPPYKEMLNELKIWMTSND